MNVTVGDVRKLVAEALQQDPLIAQLPATVMLRTAKGKVEAERDGTNVRLMMAGMSRADRLAVLRGEKAIGARALDMLHSAGLVDMGAPSVDDDYSDVDLTPDAPSAPTPPTVAASKPAKAATAPAAKAPPKDSYKVYGRLGGAPAHTRLKGQAFGAPPNTQFKNGERARVEPKDGKLAVRKVDGDHEQTWDPIDG